MNNNDKFLDQMDAANNMAKKKGFTNVKDWAHESHRNGEISAALLAKVEQLSRLRNMCAHGNARNISVADDELAATKQIISKLNSSGVCGSGKRTKTDAEKLKSTPNKINIPDGIFRSGDFYKELSLNVKGKTYDFSFRITWERNGIDTGDGGIIDTGFFIHIISAPELDYALGHPHEFHIINRDLKDPYICWSQEIHNFSQANAVMFAWHKLYVKALIAAGDISGKHTSPKIMLPTGTFRAHNEAPSQMKITDSVYKQIINTLGTRKPELGGMLGSSHNGLIDTFVFDSKAKTNSAEYHPSTKYLSSIINNEWADKGIGLTGFVHSHPYYFRELSGADVEYAKEIILAAGLSYLFMPIVMSSFDGKQDLLGFIVDRKGKVTRCRIDVVKEMKSMLPDDIDENLLSEIEREFERMSRQYSEQDTAALDDNDTFARIRSVIDIPYMNECTVIGIGCGGARSFYESMARIGVGNFMLMDGDISSRSNIASQNGYLSEVGMPKPVVVRQRIHDINSGANVTCFNKMLDNCLDDAWLEQNIISRIDPEKSLLCAFTDDFFAQARASRIALKYHIPFISAAHHGGTNTSEVIFWYPGVTEYSQREILRDRYEYYGSGHKNTATSVGCPIFNTTRLNALCEKIAAGLLIYSKHPDSKWCSFLNKMFDRNLVLVRQSYSGNDPFGLNSLFGDDPRSFFDEVVWVNPEEITDLSKAEPEEFSDLSDTRKIFPGTDSSDKTDQ